METTATIIERKSDQHNVVEPTVLEQLGPEQPNSNNVRHWCVYIIRAENGALYTGISNDFQRRWQNHMQSGKGAKFFRISKPAKLEYLEVSNDRSSASRREAAIKKLNARQKESVIRCQAPVPVKSIKSIICADL